MVIRIRGAHLPPLPPAAAAQAAGGVTQGQTIRSIKAMVAAGWFEGFASGYNSFPSIFPSNRFTKYFYKNETWDRAGTDASRIMYYADTGQLAALGMVGADGDAETQRKVFRYVAKHGKKTGLEVPLDRLKQQCQGVKGKIQALKNELTRFCEKGGGLSKETKPASVLALVRAEKREAQLAAMTPPLAAPLQTELDTLRGTAAQAFVAVANTASTAANATAATVAAAILNHATANASAHATHVNTAVQAAAQAVAAQNPPLAVAAGIQVVIAAMNTAIASAPGSLSKMREDVRQDFRPQYIERLKDQIKLYRKELIAIAEGSYSNLANGADGNYISQRAYEQFHDEIKDLYEEALITIQELDQLTNHAGVPTPNGLMDPVTLVAQLKNYAKERNENSPKAVLKKHLPDKTQTVKAGGVAGATGLIGASAFYTSFGAYCILAATGAALAGTAFIGGLAAWNWYNTTEEEI